MKLKRLTLPLAAIALCLSAAAVARADVIAFTGSRDFSGGQPGVPNPVRCGPAPPEFLVDRAHRRGDFQPGVIHLNRESLH